MREAPALSGSRAALVRVSASIASRNRASRDAALCMALTTADGSEVDEVILQSHLFVGFPDALEAMVRWRELGGSGTPDPYPEASELWRSRGERVCSDVYGANYEKLRRNVVSLHPDLDRWMVEGGYGRVIGRPGLDLATRELCIAALLAVWGAPRQLHSHLRGALNAGASPDEVQESVEIACEMAEEDVGAVARDLLARIVAGTKDRTIGIAASYPTPAEPAHVEMPERR
ncbi:MAG: carboxymuconolactone decarboxylase family protein [Gemmatimonadetes bacterium]|nr:carboxymuconolactone decarboxylase family protein [Gemmatimonadota bacterium]